MKHFVYVLKSINFKKSYVGITNDLNKRLKQHNSGHGKFTKLYKPWKLIHFESYNLLSEARKWEIYLKSASGRRLVLKKIFDTF